MSILQINHIPVAKTGMLIRKPVSKVFEAFINPEITTKFWFTKSSGILEVGEKITWTWEMYNVSSNVNVKEIEHNKRILVEWSGYGSPTLVEWNFISYEDKETYVSIIHSGFEGNGDKIVNNVLSSREGFAWVLAGLKAYLEHNIVLNLIGDAFPKI